MAKRLPLFIWGERRRGPMIGSVGRVLVVVALDVLVVVAVVLAKDGATWAAVPTLVYGSISTGALVGAVNYLFWLPRYDAL